MFDLSFSLAAFTAAFVLVVLAEMGDKTQFVAMLFASRYSPSKVLFAIFLAVVANFAIVVAIGEALTTIIPLDIISLAASLSFIGFGLWNIREEKPEGEKFKVSKFGVVATVAFTFFIAEFGDKTQLATLSLAAQYQNPLTVLIGATLGMLVADGVGIVIGVVFCRRLPQRALKWVSAVTFVAFGLVGAYEVLSVKVSMFDTALIILLLSAFSAAVMILLAKKPKPTSKRYVDLG